MRNAFAEAVTDLASSNKKIVLLSGDIGNRLFDKYRFLFKDRFYNCGIAEACMTGVASGLAKSGFIPITYTITPFNTLRCLEQIKIDICYPNLPSIIVGTGAGLSYASLGATHHSLDDIGILRTIPNINIICPSGPNEVKFALREAINLKKPVYLRIGKKGEKDICAKEREFKIGKPIKVSGKKGRICIISSGNILQIAKDATMLLNNNNFLTDLYNMHTVKPLNSLFLNRIFKRYELIAIVEEHGYFGGVTSSILEWANSNNQNISKIIGFGTPDKFLTGYGNQQNAREKTGLSKKNIYNKIIKYIK